MTVLQLKEHRVSGSRRISLEGATHFLRLGFIPAPLSIASSTLVTNHYSNAFTEELTDDRERFRRNLTLFTGNRGLNRNETEELPLGGFENALLSSVDQDTKDARHVNLNGQRGQGQPFGRVGVT